MVGIKLIRAVGLLRVLRQFLRGEVRQEFLHDVGGPLLVGHRAQGLDLQGAQAGKLRWGKESSVPAEAHLDGLRRRQAQSLVARAQIFHIQYPPLRDPQNALAI